MQASNDTIAAIATAQGRGSIGVVRISGSKAVLFATEILGRSLQPRHATYGPFLDEKGDVLDQGIALFFPGPNSFTGEDVIELQGHGGAAVMNLLLQRCLSLGARLAHPGEFTQRAYLNGKLDLAQAESVADLIEANTSEAAKSAVRSLRGNFSRAINDLNRKLINLRMLVEAMLDFPEEDLDSEDISARNSLLDEISKALEKTLRSARQGSLLREGAHVVIAGKPNAGKSTLLNCLSGEEVALVSDIPGTTRDVIRQAIQINGIPIHIHDTAGLRETDDVVESMGIQLTLRSLQNADLVLFMTEAITGISDIDKKLLSDLPISVPKIIVFNKSDLLDDGYPDIPSGMVVQLVSAKTGDGIDNLKHEILKAIGWRDDESGIFMSRERHIQALKAAQSYLEQAKRVITIPEIFAEELKQAQAALNQITGEFTPDDLLGEIFSRFCIGK